LIIIAKESIINKMEEIIMITIIAKCLLKDGLKEKFKKTAIELIESSRKEDGCISYNLYEDLNNENILIFIEEWKDKEAINSHNNSEHFKRIVTELSELYLMDPEISLYKVVY